MPAPLFYFLLEYELRLPSVALLRSVIFSSLTCLNRAIMSSKDIFEGSFLSGCPCQTLAERERCGRFGRGGFESRCCSSGKAFFMERHQKLSIWSHWRDIRPECVACYSNKIQMGESILQCILQTSISI